jgi:hypothetical protein
MPMKNPLHPGDVIRAYVSMPKLHDYLILATHGQMLATQ